MPAEPADLLIRNVRIVSSDEETRSGSIAVRGGKIVAIRAEADGAETDGAETDGAEADAEAGPGTRTVDGGGKLAFPGVVDAHQHWGIYGPLDEDTVSESRASAQGGVTTALTYMRTGKYYLNRGGSYGEFMPEVLRLSQGRAHVDYGFHLAPITKQHIDEIPHLVEKFGVASFKIFMFYGAHGLHGASSNQAEFLMSPKGESYDIAHFEFVMRGVQSARERFPEIADQISLSLHCETAEIMRAYTELVTAAGELSGLEAYSASRPPHSEGLAVTIASYLAHETNLPTVNLLHLSSAKAMEAALLMARTFPHVDFRREVTIGHLLATYETASGIGGKVNPPLRGQDDLEALWQHVLAGEVDWVVSDHACCRDEVKFDAEHRDDIWMAKSGFGGAEYVLPGLITAGSRRGLSYSQVAALTSTNPAQRMGLGAVKGRLAVGYDADIVLVDDEAEWTVRAADSESTQGYTPFEGFTMTAAVRDVFLRGQQILESGKVVGEPGGQYLKRPVIAR